MVASDEMTYSRASWPWWRWGLTGLSALGLALSVYLSWHYLMGGAVVGCGGGGPCEQVLSSRWSAVGGVLPVSSLAAGAYLALLLASFFIGPSTAPQDRRLAWGAMLLLVGAAIGSGIWFSIVQKWILGAFCPYCLATHITGVLLAVLVCWQAPLQRDGSSAGVAPRRTIGTFAAIGLPVAGLLLAGILAVCQVAFKPPVAYRSGTAQEAQSPGFDPHAIPLVGSPDASAIVTLLFDYKCPHCQKIHSMLKGAIERYHGTLAFALCPAPLNNKCNPYVAREVDEFKDSCELAKLGLAVWKADHQAFAAFDTWMFAVDPGHDLWHARTLDAAAAKAIALVGQQKLDAAQADPWVGAYLQSCIRIYGNTINPDQSGSAVPKLVFGTRWVTPEPQNLDDLLLVLHKNLGVPQP